jgi:predicted permease
MTGPLQDLRYALRQLRKSPGFAAVAVITLALGIGATTTIFSVVNAVLLAPLPYRDVDRLVMIWGSNPGKGDPQFPVSAGDFIDWKQKNDVFEDIAASYDDEVTLTGAGEPKLVIGYAVTPNYLEILGVAPRLGRIFTDQEAQSKTNVAVLSDKFWRTTLHADPQIVGKSITLDGKAFTVVGVMPPAFNYPPRTEVWEPLSISPAAAGDYEHGYIRVLGRLKPGVTLREAQERMNVLEGQIASQHREADAGNSTSIVPLRTHLAGDIRTPLLALSGAAGVVLLIACVNVASLLLARAAGGQADLSIRVAMGASRARLLRQFLSECLLISFLGGALGVTLALVCTRFLVAIFPNNIANLSIPRVEAVPINGPVLWFTLGLTVLTAIVFAAVPTLHSANVSPNDALRESGRTVTSTRTSRLRRILVTAEIALSLVLITGAGLMLESFRHVQEQSLGFQPEKLVGLEVFLPPSQYPGDHPERRINFVKNVIKRIQQLPGVRSVAATNFLPLAGFSGATDFLVQGQVLRTGEPKPKADNQLITPEYFSTIGTSLLRGRDLNELDGPDAEKVAIVNRTFARRYFRDTDPVDKVLEISDFGHIDKWRIIGEVSDIKAFGPEEETHAAIYRSLSQQSFPLVAFVIRATGDPAMVLKPAEQALWSVDANQPIFDAMPMSLLAGQVTALRRVSTILLGSFAVLALVLAAVGLYGVMAYSVAQRTHEIGVRMALGARGEDVLGLVLQQGAWIVVVGEFIGIIAALVAAHAVSRLLFGVSPSNPWTIAGAALLLMLVATLASYVPARRAIRVDPLVALRYE